MNNKQHKTIDSLVYQSKQYPNNMNINKKLNIYIIDKYVDNYVTFMQTIFDLYKIKAKVYPYKDMKEGIKAISSLPNTYVFMGVECQLSAIVNEQNNTEESTEYCIQKIKTNNPNAKIIILTRGNYSENEAIKTGVDGYFNKSKIATKDENGKYNFIAAIEDASKIKNSK